MKAIQKIEALFNDIDGFKLSPITFTGIMGFKMKGYSIGWYGTFYPQDTNWYEQFVIEPRNTNDGYKWKLYGSYCRNYSNTASLTFHTNIWSVYREIKRLTAF